MLNEKVKNLLETWHFVVTNGERLMSPAERNQLKRVLATRLINNERKAA